MTRPLRARAYPLLYNNYICLRNRLKALERYMIAGDLSLTMTEIFSYNEL